MIGRIIQIIPKYPVPVEAVETLEKLSIEVFHCGIKDIAIKVEKQ